MTAKRMTQIINQECPKTRIVSGISAFSFQLFYSVLIIVLFTSGVFAQKKRPSLPSDIARPDTTVIIQEQPAPEPQDQSAVEKIETKEHTIVGTRTITDGNIRW